MGSEHAGLDFWLSSISVHAPKAPIFIVGTHVDQVTIFSEERFKNIKNFLFIDYLLYKGV